MALKRPDEDFLDILGPLGGSVFKIDSRPNADHIVVGGGYGVPPLVFLIERMRSGGYFGDILAVVGARSKKLLDCVDELKSLGAHVICSTDDGSFGVKGRVTDALKDIIDADSSIYCCGPTPMMRAVGELALQIGASCQVSLEVSMACGVGVCMGCVVDLSDGKRVRACVEGPVFEFGKVRW
jgi:dihydroorotate dehydrogenase electron transfer subunit